MQFDRTFNAKAGEVVEIRPGIRRITAPNPGPMTFMGTNSYLVGQDSVVIIDPGPNDEAHLAALTLAIGDAHVAAIVVTHTHRDHSPLARALKAHTGTPIIGAGPHRFARPFKQGDALLDVAVDDAHAPDAVLADGERLTFGDGTLEAVATPGHTMNHLCFALAGTDVLFSGDHAMAWSTSLVAPPDGEMSAYLASLQKLLQRKESLYLPGHGAELHDAHGFVQQLLDHRMEREAAILTALQLETLSISALVDRLYDGLDPRLRGAAGLSVLAHLERLESLGQAARVPGPEGLWQAG
ncbi:MAG: MBL fold metallo-hydrolase [Devosiaceae bacterium]